ncbi:MAG: dTDP-glucose 4,6-dehydratase [Melioribacteraceae bacterium]|nr:dTDP-glucose 4,6-dehydratase [Melioribacteraceae bacterium]MCF8354530.1 dTDP-glucose 4,6-dehydratase [Melioribacteraceae bacterium]MCF8394299.1 dTDP-glucose 4,6-dehydratase [Melioribacteraceae bacterium]MCF8418199.1 dTDP-glucose 4,6-dehydratase [Melioribacteraceae bacterium]
MKRILVTGGAGFIGSNFINYILENRDDVEIINVDKLTYAGNLENLKPSEDKSNYHFVRGDICNHELIDYLFSKYKINSVINFAAESHVDRSILGSEIFYQTNVIGTNVLLEAAKRFEVERFLQISTDEVYGSLGATGRFTEHTPLSPNSPYSSSKAAADMMAMAFHHTYGLPVVITRCSNNYGPLQFPEKLIPLMIINAMHDKKLPVYGDGMNVRDWIYVIDHNRAVEAVFEKGKIGGVYNIGADQEMPNIEIVKLILNSLGKSESLIEYVKDRPGHDRRYAIDSSKIETELDWKPKYKFDEAIVKTIEWYKTNKNWWEKIISGEYQKYYEKQYGK